MPTTQTTLPHHEGLCWIHLQELRFFVRLGVSPQERAVGHNLTIDCSLQIPFEKTTDKIENTLDYGLLIQAIDVFLKDKFFHLLEYLAEQLSEHLLGQFATLAGIFLRIHKAYLPIPEVAGKVSLEVLTIRRKSP